MHTLRFEVLSIAALACGFLTLQAAADSQVRIVRLSDVQGGVQIDRNSGLGFERAFMNLPITQGTQVHTLQNGRAEIEFEDGSTLRLAPDTSVSFGKLSASDEGKRASEVTLVRGRAYVGWLGRNGDDFILSFASEKVDLTHAAHFRVENSSAIAELANFKSPVEVVGSWGTVKVEKNRTASFGESGGQPTIAKDVKKDPYDEWDSQSAEYHQEYSKHNNTPYGYGFSDLSYYGSYSNVPGFGMLWQPFFISAEWNPFMDGAWAFYPGMGYMWASAYPWGWLPYYYGNWMYAPGYGWGWQPGAWNNWRGGLHYVGAMAANFHAPVAPTGTRNTVIVGLGGAVAARPGTSTMLLTSGSAGFGIPRGAYDNMRHLNRLVGRNRSVELRSQPQFAATSMGMGGFNSGPVRRASVGPARSGYAAPAGAHSAAGHAGR